MKEFKDIKKLEVELYKNIKKKSYSQEQEAMWIYESLIKIHTLEKILIRKKIILPEEIAREQSGVMKEAIAEMKRREGKK